MKKPVFLLLAVIAMAVSCKDKNPKKYLPESIGAINSVAVIMDNDLWKGEVGDKVREHFAAPVLGLSWEEPIFTLNHMPISVFTGTLRHTRSILFVEKDTLSIAHIKTDVYATPQKVGVIKGRTDDEIIKNLDAKADLMISAFKELEIKEAQKRFLRSLNQEGVLEKKFGVSMSIPSAYKVGKQEDNFVWIDRQIPKGSLNIIAYTMPGDSFKNDSTRVKDIVRMRDSIGQEYIPGPDVPGKTTYMVTEKAFAPYTFPAKISGKDAIEVKGIWEMKNYPMAGPYITYIIDDKEHNRKMVVEGFTFAPATEKRDYMFELEAILRSIKFDVPKNTK
ncbi:DUF4837 family protein [Flavobacteriaceae bacterium F89]|jgi:hypothetical protein|uniref:DUF4837 family protein n=1 Tax=Cerina litoralis TaxID=2874477 RepID=A0AAE3EQK6_9FLAO|nr:DUF4837 family protein [Cerina litoralis]MCG2459203.1 DUF4837 family protein [Cerina litoralis]